MIARERRRDPSRPLPRSTRTDTLKEAIAEAILEGAMVPGQRLDEVSLAQRYGVSRTPVREALKQLAAIELVDFRPHRGAIVADLDLARMIELFEALGEAEAACARLAASKMGGGEREQLELLYEACDRALRASDQSAIPTTNRTWHEAIYAGAHNGFLADTVMALRRRLAPFSRAQFRLAERPQASSREHEAVMAALRGRDPEAAAAAMRRHIASVSRAWQTWSAEAALPPGAAG